MSAVPGDAVTAFLPVAELDAFLCFLAGVGAAGALDCAAVDFFDLVARGTLTLLAGSGSLAFFWLPSLLISSRACRFPPCATSGGPSAFDLLLRSAIMDAASKRLKCEPSGAAGDSATALLRSCFADRGDLNAGSSITSRRQIALLLLPRTSGSPLECAPSIIGPRLVSTEP